MTEMFILHVICYPACLCHHKYDHVQTESIRAKSWKHGTASNPPCFLPHWIGLIHLLAIYVAEAWVLNLWSLLVLVFPSRLITTGKSVEPMVQKEGRRLHGALMCFSTWWSCSLYMQSVTEYIHVLRVVFQAKPHHWRTALRTWREIWPSRSHTLIWCTSTWLNNVLYTYSITGHACVVEFMFCTDVSTQKSNLDVK